MKYIIFNWKSYLNLKETSSLSKLIASIPKSKKHKIIIVYPIPEVGKDVLKKFYIQWIRQKLSKKFNF